MVLCLKESPGSDNVVKVLAPWSLDILKYFVTQPSSGEDCPPPSKHEVPPLPLGSKLPKAIFATMEAARRRALDANDPQQSTFFQDNPGYL